MNEQKNLNDLPESQDPEFWEDAEKHVTKPVKIVICDTHTPQLWDKQEYIDNKDGTISCKVCWWGTSLPGWYRIHDEKIVDLRKL